QSNGGVPSYVRVVPRRGGGAMLHDGSELPRPCARRTHDLRAQGRGSDARTNARGARWTARNGDLRGVPLEFAAARGDATSVHAWTRGRRPSGGVPAGCSKPANSGTAEAWCLAVVPRGDAARPQEKKTPVDRS